MSRFPRPSCFILHRHKTQRKLRFSVNKFIPLTCLTVIRDAMNPLPLEVMPGVSTTEVRFFRGLRGMGVAGGKGELQLKCDVVVRSHPCCEFAAVAARDSLSLSRSLYIYQRLSVFRSLLSRSVAISFSTPSLVYDLVCVMLAQFR